MGGLPRRLDDKSAEVQVARQLASLGSFLDQSGDARMEIRENVHLFHI
jgi:hypothetical protein